MTKDLTSGNPLKVILLFTLPLMLGNLFQQFYALADTIIVGRFCGVSALASVGATGSVNYLILGFVGGVCNGFAIPIAQLFGARDYKDLRRHVANAAWLCIVGSVVLTIATVALTRPMMELMQTPEDIIDGALNELVVTGRLEDSISNVDGEDLESLIAYLKQQMVENGLDDEEGIQDAVDAACEEYDISLTDEEKAQIVDLLLKLSKLNLDADTINKAQKLLDSLTSVTDSGSQIGTFFANLWKAISDFFQNLFG